MTEEENTPPETTPDADVTTPQDVQQQPRGNPDTDEDALAKGEEVLDRVKPY